MSSTESSILENIPEDQVDDSSSIEDAEVGSPVRYEISSYGADYPVDSLVKRISRKDIYVPEFQRGFIWTHAQASRFIESLLLGLPVPGIFLFREPDTQKLVVVDGQQRLRTLEMFYEGIIRGHEFVLRGVCKEMEDLTYRRLSQEDRRRLDDAILHATIFQQEDPKQDRSSIYLIFERLNTGGTPLASQEIRSCVYRGELNELLKKLSNRPKWLDIYGNPSPRGKDQELILRFFALHYNRHNYERPMKTFLNGFMEANRNPPPEKLMELEKLFDSVATIAADNLTRSSFRPERNLNAAVVDAFFIAIAKRLNQGPIKNPSLLKQAAETVLTDHEFVDAVMSGTTDSNAISRRLRVATTAFARVE